MTDDKPPLSRHDEAWVRHIRPWLHKRIAKLRDQLEQPGMPAIETEHVRGGIAELRELIMAVEPELPEDGTSGAYFVTGQQPT